MIFSIFLNRIESNGLFHRAFEDFLVYHDKYPYIYGEEEFGMLCMGGEL